MIFAVEKREIVTKMSLNGSSDEKKEVYIAHLKTCE